MEGGVHLGRADGGSSPPRPTDEAHLLPGTGTPYLRGVCEGFATDLRRICEGGTILHLNKKHNTWKRAAIKSSAGTRLLQHPPRYGTNTRNTMSTRADILIAQGAERIEAALRRNRSRDEALQELCSRPGAMDKIKLAFLHFATGSTSPSPVEILRKIGDDGNMILTSWVLLADFSLSTNERDFLAYMGVIYNSWGDDFKKPNFSPHSDLYCEAVADLLEVEVEMRDEIRESRLAEMQERGRRSRYERYLRFSWEAGATFEELMEVEPATFGIADLSQGAGDSGITTKREAVLLALAYGYKLLQRERTRAYHSLRDIAKEAGVDYATILEAYTLIREVSTREKRVKMQRG